MRLRNSVAVLGILFAAVAGAVQADCLRNVDGEVVCGGGQCDSDQYGKVYCAAVGGGAARDTDGVVMCGAGACSRDDEGQVWCSRERGGGAELGSDGNVVCLGGCGPGSAALCQPMK